MTVDLVFGSWQKPGPPRSYQNLLPPAPVDGRTALYLLANETWNDFGYGTDFLAHVFSGGEWTSIGNTGVAVVGQSTGTHTYDLLGRPKSLPALPESCFALGQSLEYYKELVRHLSEERALEVLHALGDIAIDEERRMLAIADHTVLDVSLTRSNSALEALEQAALLFGGSASDTTDAFSVELWLRGATGPHRFAFDFTPDALPRNISVLVGVNGTGKTQSMAALARRLSRVDHGTDEPQVPAEDLLGKVTPRPSIYGVVAVSFSAFDDFIVPNEVTSDRFKYVYCGLQSLQHGGLERGQIVDTEVAARFLPLSPEDRIRALAPLQPTLDASVNWVELCATGRVPISEFSAGQRIVLSVTSELIRHVTNRVLVMMDEPEIHLHPQLLSGLMAWIQDLLVERQSFAIVATHSPIVVQQALSSSVHVLRRDGTQPSITRPSIETFGANLTEIVREVFEDRAGDRSYQAVLEALWSEHGSADRVMTLFGGRLGLNAEIYLRGLDAR